MDERSFFDNLAPVWDQNEVRSTPERVNRILDLIDIHPAQNILDLGTGTGVLLPYIAERVGEGGRITAIDYSEGMLSRAKEKYGNLNPTPSFINLDFETETIEGVFDRIILYCVYPHLHEPIDTLRWLRKVNLSENGRIIIAFPSSEKFINNIHRERHSDSDALPPAKNLAEFFQAHGFDAEVTADDDDAYVITLQ